MLFVVVQSLSCVRLLVNPWTAACHASLSFTISQSLLKLMSTELVMSSHAFAFNLFKSFNSNWFYYNQHIFACCFFSSDNLWLLFNLLWPFAFNIIDMVKLKFTILLVIFIPFFVPFFPYMLVDYFLISILLNSFTELFFFTTFKKYFPTVIPLAMCVCVLSRVQLFVTPWTVPTRLLCPWNFPSKNTEVHCRFLFQGIFLTLGSNLHLLYLLHWQADSLTLSHLGSSTIGNIRL